MKLIRIAAVLSFGLWLAPAFAQSNPGTSPLTPAKGGTNSAYVGFTGPTTSVKTFTLPNASDTIATLAAIQTFSAAKTFNAATLLLAGSSSGTTTLNASAAASGTLTLPAATDTLVARNTTDTLTNKTLTSPTLTTPSLGVATATSINKVTITAPATAATLTIPDGVTLTGPASSGTAMTLGNTETVTGVKTFGSAGAVGRLKVAGTTSGAITLDATAVAGTGTLTLPAATDTLVGKATTDTLTNKTFDTAGTGNSFSINGLAATANTGTGAVARAAGPTFTTPTLGAATATSINGNFFTAGTYTLAGAASKTFTFNNTLTVAGTDGTTLTFQGTDTYVGRATTDTLTNKTLTSPAISGPTITGTADVQQALTLSGDISPSQLVANTNDWAPTGFSTASTIRFSTDASRNITGLAGGADGRIIILHNIGAQNGVLINNSGSSSSGNKFFIGGDITLGADTSITLRYDATSMAWRAITTPGSGGGGGGSVTSVTVAAGAGIAVSGTCTITTSGTCTVAVDGSFGFRNRLLNPSGQIWQLANSGAAAITDVTYAFDQWYGLTQTAGVTASQVTDAENGTPYMMRLSQANASAQRFGLAQPLESVNIKDTRGKAVTLSSRVRMSASTTLRYAIVEWTGTADAPTKDVVNDWTSGTFTTGNFFISTTTTICGTGSVALTANTLTDITPLTCTPSSSMNNLIVVYWTDSTQAQNVTLDIGRAQLEIGSTATQIAVLPYQVEQAAASRYLRVIGNGLSSLAYVQPGMAFNGTIFRTAFTFETVMRVAPTGSVSAASDFQIDDTSGPYAGTSVSFTTNPGGFQFQVNVASGLTAARAGFLIPVNTNARIYLKAQL